MQLGVTTTYGVSYLAQKLSFMPKGFFLGEVLAIGAASMILHEHLKKSENTTKQVDYGYQLFWGYAIL